LLLNHSHNTSNIISSQARTLQSSLAALAERIDEVKSDHDKLESENRFLQDYIGGLTRTMSKEHVASTSGKKGKK
jgi:short coiled-coil protein